MITTSQELEDLIDSTVSIPTIPSTLMEINRVLLSPDGSAKQAAAVIDKDPALAAKVLRLVNSSFYGLRNPVTGVPLACSILGLKVIKNIVVQAVVLETFSSTPEIKDFDTQWLWDHSFKTALAARLLAAAAPTNIGLDREEAYTCGLIHDIGKMILLQSSTEQFADALRESKKRKLPLAKIEGEMFGFSHAHVGGLLAQRWKLSPATQVGVMYHHSPGGSPEEWAKGFLVQAANTIAHEAATGSGGWIGDRCDADSMKLLNLPEGKLSEIREQVQSAKAC